MSTNTGRNAAEEWLEEMAEASLSLVAPTDLDLEMLTEEATAHIESDRTRNSIASAAADPTRVLGGPSLDVFETGVTGAKPSFHAPHGLSDIFNARLVQQKMDDLEKEITRLRRENEDLAAAGKGFRDRLQSAEQRASRAESELKDLSGSRDAEMTLLKSTLQARDQEIHQLTSKVEELERRLQFDIQKIRVREKELEHRLEILSLEKSALLKNKDQALLELKMKQDSLVQEASQYRQQLKKLNSQMDSQQDRFRKTAMALRLALSNIEINEDLGSLLKKAE